YSPTGQDNWTTTPADWNTSSLDDGLYDLHVVATDAAGNTTVSDAVAAIRVDNTAPSVTMNDPGTVLHGTVALSATATDDGSGVDTTTFEYTAAGQSDWHSADASWDTTGVADGLYDLRATGTDTGGDSTDAARRADGGG